MAQLRLARVAGMGGILPMMRDFYAFERRPLDEGRSPLAGGEVKEKITVYEKPT